MMENWGAIDYAVIGAAVGIGIFGGLMIFIDPITTAFKNFIDKNKKK